jgi:sugar (pentulose or hexulose) kinase
MIKVIAVFDIGKTNKKFLLFDLEMKLVFSLETEFDEISDEDGFPCDDIVKMETWMNECLVHTIEQGNYQIEALNFSTYGASLVYLDGTGKRIAPVYNYLKPMPSGVLDGFYEKYGGVEEFSRITASPTLGMLNSGMQILWLKEHKPDVYKKVKTILHLPQYLSNLFTREIVSEYTSIGCHTAMWDFDNNQYHQWLADEGIHLPNPVANSTTFDVEIAGQRIKVGIGIHDSSASLVPYLKASNEKFILISTGTWCIFMNPFNVEPLSIEQLRNDALCYLSIQQLQVKSSRLFFGHIHDTNVGRIASYFNVDADFFKRVDVNQDMLNAMLEGNHHQLFFKEGIPECFIDYSVDLSIFKSVEEAYHKLMCDLVELSMESLKLIIAENDQTETVYISGGFARNGIFVKLIEAHLPHKRVLTLEIDNSSALGAMMVLEGSVLFPLYFSG